MYGVWRIGEIELVNVFGYLAATDDAGEMLLRVGIVRLHHRIEQLGDRDRLLRSEPFREVVALEDARDRRRPRQSKDLREVERAEPFAVEADFGALRVDDRGGGFEVAFCVRVDHRGVDDRTLGLPP